jgi:pyruvate,water dikinase
MDFLNRIFSVNKQAGAEYDYIESLKSDFRRFLEILDLNNEILLLLADLEEKSGGDYIFDKNYISTALDKLNLKTENLLELIIKLGGSKYERLTTIYSDIKNRTMSAALAKAVIPNQELVVNLNIVTKEDNLKCGSKSANLGELRNILKIPTPDGFCITTKAYIDFLSYNNIRTKIRELLGNSNIRSYSDLKGISTIIRQFFENSIFFPELSEEIFKYFKSYSYGKRNHLMAFRSSAIGEDTNFSFAGQYESVLGVTLEKALRAYITVLASKFSPKAIYYYLNHSLSEEDLAMGCCCLEMIDAASSGIVYSTNPINPDDNTILINSIYGLGKFAVDGEVSPDIISISKDDKQILSRSISEKKRCMRLKSDGSIIVDKLAEDMAMTISISDAQALELARYAMIIESHYGCPQDIEWAISQSGDVYILQTRPLEVIRMQEPKKFKANNDYKLLFSEGETACPGAACGTVVHVRSPKDYIKVTKESIIVTESPYPGLAAALPNAKALIVGASGIASHLITIAREYRIPTITGFANFSNLTQDELITVCATEKKVYLGNYSELIEAYKSNYNEEDNSKSLKMLQSAMPLVSRLNLIEADSVDFSMENIKSYHDIIRYIHQKSIEILFEKAESKPQSNIYSRLESELPLAIDIIELEKALPDKRRRKLSEGEIESLPFKSFWNSAVEEGWSEPRGIADAAGLIGLMATDLMANKTAQLSKRSYAIVASEYMVLSLNMGYHFSTIEAMASKQPNRNYIKYTFKDGGASVERRIRRIELIKEILTKYGFKCKRKGDYFEARCDYHNQNAILVKLRLLGKLTMLTRQLDLQLKTDDDKEIFKEKIFEKLINNTSA